MHTKLGSKNPLHVEFKQDFCAFFNFKFIILLFCLSSCFNLSVNANFATNVIPFGNFCSRNCNLSSLILSTIFFS